MQIVQEDILKLVIAVLLGSIIGAEREYRTKSAGFRTLILVCVGSALFTIFSRHIGGVENADRIAANIITGIGFMGAGAIFSTQNRISGITTATTIWMSAAIGMGVGSGEYLLCTIATLMVVLVLLAFPLFDSVIDRSHQSRSYKIVCPFEKKDLYDYEKLFKQYGLSSRRGKQSREADLMIGSWEVRGSKKNHELLTRKLLTDNNIKSLDF
jgi:putative Mg2+ transporter-C (MgtC) family protein